LKQIYCSYSRTHNIDNGFLHSLLSFLMSTLLLNRNKHIGEEKTYWCLSQIRLFYQLFEPKSMFSRVFSTIEDEAFY